MATVELAKVTGTTSPAVATVQITRVAAIATAAVPAFVQITQVAAFVQAAVDGTSLLVQYTEQGWQRITGLVRWNGADWVSAGGSTPIVPPSEDPAGYGQGVYGAGVYGR